MLYKIHIIRMIRMLCRIQKGCLSGGSLFFLFRMLCRIQKGCLSGGSLFFLCNTCAIPAIPLFSAIKTQK